MSLNQFINKIGNGLNISIDDLKCDTCECTNMVIPSGGDLDVHDVLVQDELKVKCTDSTFLTLKTPNIGTLGQSITSNGDGTLKFETVSGGGGGVQNPLTSNLDIGSFDIVGVGIAGLNTINGMEADIILTTGVSNANQAKVENVHGVVSNSNTSLYGKLTMTDSNIDLSSNNLINIGSGNVNLETYLSTNDTNVSTLISELNTAEVDIGTNSTAITTLISELNTAEVDIGTNSTAITTLISELDTAEVDIGTNSTAITTLETKTQNLTATATENTFTGILDAVSYKENGNDSLLIRNPIATNFLCGSNAGAGITTADDCIFIGENTGVRTSTGQNNVALGHDALQKQSVSLYNTAIGNRSQKGNNNSVSGNSNTTLGFQTMYQFTNACHCNTVIGHLAGQALDNSTDNVFIGCKSNEDPVVVNNSVALGNETSNFAGSNSIAIGHSVSTIASNTCVIGNSDITEMRSEGNGICDLGTTSFPYKESFVKDGVDIDSGEWKIGYDAENLTVTNTDGYSQIIGRPTPVGSKSTTMSHIDMRMTADDMISSITSAGAGVNKYWGHTATYNSIGPLLIGRIVSITSGGDGSTMRIDYVKTGAGTAVGTYPLGITLETVANANDPCKILIAGICSAISMNSVASPNKGSLVLGPGAGGTGSTADGRVRVGVAAAATEMRLGCLYQKNAITLNGPCLVNIHPYYQGT